MRSGLGWSIWLGAWTGAGRLDTRHNLGGSDDDFGGQGGAQWPEQWRREGVAEGRREGVAQERALLRRLAAVRFGDAVAGRIEDLLRTTEDWDQLAAAAELIVRADTGPGLIDAVARSIRPSG